MTALPPLLAIAEGKRVKPHRKAASGPKEIQLQFDSAKLFELALRKDWRAWHTPNGELRKAFTKIDKLGRKKRICRDGAKLKRMGVKPGHGLDWVLVSPAAKAHFIELKRLRPKGTLTKNEQEFILWCQLNNIPWAVCYTLAEVIEIAKLWDAFDPAIKV